MARIATKTLAALCRRTAISLESGIDERKIWRRESGRASGELRTALDQVARALEEGQSLSDSLSATGTLFPPLFLELAALGESTGKQATVFRRLADHYEHRVKLRRAFLAGITWPMIQLGIAIVVVGLLIWVLGLIADRMGEAPYDILGLGLRGSSGLLVYVAFIASMFALGCIIYYVVTSGAAWTRPVQRLVMRLPAIGTCLRTLSMSQLSWTLGLSLEAGMDIRRALPFALRSTRNDYYVRHVPEVTAAIERGDDVFTTLAATGAFPDDFLDALQVGEQSGRLDESMLRLADIYQDRARAALSTLTTLAGFAVWAFVALMIIAIIVRIVSSYAGFIQDLANPP